MKETEMIFVGEKVSYTDIAKVNDEIKTVAIKGKNYAEVPQRINAFRKLYPQGYIKTELVRLDEDTKTGICVIKAEVGLGDTILATGYAYEKANSTFINKTSYIENCETSAVGRALGNAGFGIDTSVASAEEVINAINNQNNPANVPADDPDNILICNKCGKTIDIKVHDYSARRYGRPLCRDCQQTEPPIR